MNVLRASEASRGAARTPVPRPVRALLGLLLVVVTALSVMPTGTSRAAAPPECAPLPTFSSHQPYAQDAASLMAVGQLLKPRANTQVWDAAAGRPRPEFTLYEAMGMSGLTWSHSTIHQQEQFRAFEPRSEYACAYLPPALNTVANSIFDLAKLVTAGAISFRQLASNPQLVVGLLDGAVAPVNRVSTGLFLAMSTVMVMLTGALIAFTGGFRGPGKQRELLQALLGVGVFMIIGTFLVIPSTQDSERKPNYYWLTTSALDTINRGNAELSSLLLPRDTSRWCSTTGRDARRTFDCLVYQNVVLEPWAIGQFGTRLDQPMPYQTAEVKRFADGANKLIAPERQRDTDVRLVQLWTQGRTASELAYGTRPPGDPTDAANDKVDQRQGQWNIVREVMWSHYHDQFPTWSGANSGERISLAFSSLLMSLLVGAFLIVTSGLLLLWNVVLVVLFFFLPVIALLGLFPPTQRIFRSWLQTWLKALLLSFVFQLGQTFAMLMVTAALKVPAIGMGMKSALLAIMLIALWKIVQFFRGDHTGLPGRTRAEGSVGATGSVGAAGADGGPLVNVVTRAAAAAGAAGAVAAGATTGRVPGVNRVGPMARNLNAPSRKKSDAKVTAAVAEAEERWVAEHGVPMDDRARARVRDDVMRTLGSDEPRARRGGRSLGLDAPMRRAAREEAAERMAGEGPGAGPAGATAAGQGQPSIQVNATNYNYFRGGPGVARASESGERDTDHTGADRGPGGEAAGLAPSGRLTRRAAGGRDDRPAGVREQANEARAMESVFRQTLSAGADERTTVLARAESFARQLAEAERAFTEARTMRDQATRDFQLVTGRHLKGHATEDELADSRRRARQASAQLEIATTRVRHRAHIARSADQAAGEFR
ncbi:type IV secretion system protein [Mariniluteicoccus flavus]